MRNSVTRRGFVGSVAGLSLTAGIVGRAAPDSPPDPTNIQKLGRGWRVYPTGGDDHDNFEWALRNTEPGGTVKLEDGVYKLGSTVVVPNFDGKLIGAGANETTLTCTDVYSYEVWEAPGGGRDLGEPVPPRFPRVPIAGTTTRVAPGFIFFYKTPMLPGEDPDERANRIEIRDMRCRGAMRGDDWTFGDEVLCFTICNTTDFTSPDSLPVTTRQDVLISNIEVDGYATDAFPIFGNACACITVAGGLVLTDNYDLNGSIDGDMFGAANGGILGMVPALGDVTFNNCTFRNCRVGPGVVGHKDSHLLFDGITTDGCRGNCVQLFDNSGCTMEVRNGNLFCDSFLLPPELTVDGVSTDVPSSLGCVVAFQGLAAAVGSASNLRWLSLAFDAAAHAAHPEAGPIGTWRPLGPALVPAPSTLQVVDNVCQSSRTINTYCFHVIDLILPVFGTSSIDATIKNNTCQDSQTCISMEFVDAGLVKGNLCSSLETGVELYVSPNVAVEKNEFDFSAGGGGCEIRVLVPGEKIDFSRLVTGAGACWAQTP